jgi:DNA-directed RNA polymerase specialized sigma24 family protein
VPPHWRSETRQLRLLARTGADPVIEPFTDQVDAQVTASAVKPRLAEALSRLPKAQRDALLLQAWADLTYDQIARATGVQLGTVQSRISRARHRLREQLADLFMGFKDVAIRDHAMTGTDGTRYVKAGHVMGWAALLGQTIVEEPG